MAKKRKRSSGVLQIPRVHLSRWGGAMQFPRGSLWRGTGCGWQGAAPATPGKTAFCSWGGGPGGRRRGFILARRLVRVTHHSTRSK